MVVATPVGGVSFVQAMDDETDAEKISFSLPNDDLASKGVGKRSCNYSNQEDTQLCKSWASITMDPIVGNEQPERAYWKRIAKHYHKNRDFNSHRNANSLEHRWSTLQKHCMKFQACYDQVERRHPSGIPYKEHLIESQELYASTNHNRAFQYVHCWLQVRNNQKFQALNFNAKKSKSSSPFEGTGEEEGEARSKSPITESTQKRPPGRKQAKDKENNEGEYRPYEEALKGLLEIKEIEGKLKEERWRQTKSMKERKISIEERKLMWEQEKKVMFCDVNTLEGNVKTYVLAMRAKIANAKVAELKRNFGGASSSFGGDLSCDGFTCGGVFGGTSGFGSEFGGSGSYGGGDGNGADLS